MNILIDYLASNTGGGKTVAQKQIENLIKYDKKNNYYVLIKKGNDICEDIKDDRLNIIEIDYRNLLHRLFLQFFIFPKYLKKYNIDILFCPNNFIWYFKNDIYKITMYQNTKNLILNLKDMKYFLLYYLTKKSLKYCNKNIFVSNYIKQNNEGIVDYLGIEIEKENVEQVNNQSKQYDISLIVSNFSKHKNMDILFNITRNYYSKYNKKLKIIIIGGDRNIRRFEKYKNRFENDEYGEFTVTGLIPKNEVDSYINTSKLYLSVSLLEAFPLTQFEALFNGVPILLSDIPIYKELMGDYDIYINPYNSEKIAEKIHWIFEHYDEYTELMNKLKENAKKYTWENHAKTLIDIFNTALRAGDDA